MAGDRSFEAFEKNSLEYESASSHDNARNTSQVSAPRSLFP